MVDPGDRWIGRKTELVPLGIDDLRDEGDVGEAGGVAMAEAAGPGILREKLFERPKPCIDPVIVPSRDVAFVAAEGVREIAQNPQIVDGVDVAGDNLGEPANPRPVRRVLRQQGRIGICLIEILDDRQGLDQGSAIIL